MHYRDRYFNHVRGRSIRGKRGPQYQCVCCKKWFPKNRITVDHIIPMRKGGINCIGNLQGMCRSCNSRKGPRITHREWLRASFRIALEGKLHLLFWSVFKMKMRDIFHIPYKRET